MREQIWVSSHPNGGRRVHRRCGDHIHLQDKKEAIKKATEIAKRMNSELKIQKKGEEVKFGNSYGGDPFPPRDRKTIWCGRDPFPPRVIS